MELVRALLAGINQIFEAGIAITAFSLFIRALTFNLRERVSRSFAIILLCVIMVFSGEAISSAVDSASMVELWLRFQWLGIVLFPASAVHFSDALLETTGRPSRGRRRSLVRLGYIISIGFLVTLPFGNLVGPISYTVDQLPYLTPTTLSRVFSVYYLLAVILSAWWVWRAYSRTKLAVSRRRFWYLMLGALFLAIGTYPYLQLGSGFAARNTTLFIALATFGNLFVFIFLLAMAYAVAFFGISWPDRIVKSRLLKWFLRGPVTIFVVLLLMTFIYRAGEFIGASYAVAIPIFTVTTVLLMEHVITLIYPFIERWFFYGDDRENIELVQDLSERLLTSSDLRQFLEAVLASVCDRFQVETAFLASLSDTGLDYVVQVGAWKYLKEDDLSKVLLDNVSPQNEGNPQPLFAWGDFWLHPLHSPQDGALMGLLGVLRHTEQPLDPDMANALILLGKRAALALEDRRVQTQIFQALEELSPQVELIQRLRAATRYDQSGLLSDLELLEQPKDLNRWVKDALTHYWGGPKLTQSPLLNLQIVQSALQEHDDNPANALRSILKEGIERVRPEGERRFTPEWILYNILEMKFMEGRKVREIALRLAMSEADLYRKQRVAIEEVANAIVDMERVARAN